MAEAAGQIGSTRKADNLSLEALAESEQRFRALVESLPEAILVHSEN
jgi:PAS domain-containing protein